MNERELPWTRLGLAGGALAASVLFVHVPAVLWAGNAAQLHLPIGRVLALGLAVDAVCTGLFVLVLRWLPVRPRSMVASFAAALGVIEWIYGLLLAGGMQALDGVRDPLEFSRSVGLWELGLVVAIGLTLAAWLRRRVREAVLLLTMLNVGLVVVTGAALVTAGRADWTTPSNPGPVSRFSSRMNVLVLLLDGLESSVAERVLEADPSLKASFEGFSLYPDTLSTAPTTALSLPAIHSGEVHDGTGAALEYFSEAIGRRSFLTRFARAGFEVSLVHPEQGICPDGLTTCTTPASVLGIADQEVRREVLRLFDLSLLRVLPFRAKRWVWDQGRWRFSRQAGVHEQVTRLIEANDMIDRIAGRLTVDANMAPTLKFVHSLATHAPYVINDDCRTVSMESRGPGRADVQARCALSAVARLLGRLQAAGIYDRTIALVLADHGMDPALDHGSQDQARAFRQLAGSANPLFLYKPLRSRGPMRTGRAVVSLVDVGATLCAEAAACTTRSGIPVGQAPPDRPRRFNDYVWRHRFWRTLDVPRVTPYEVRGPLGRRDSWHRLRGSAVPGGASLQKERAR
jgi:hypothetical protein